MQYSKVKVALEGHGIYPSFGVSSISPEPFERFKLNFTQVFLSVSRCKEPMTQNCRLKVQGTLQGLGIYPSLFCPLHIFWTLWTIFIKLQSNVPLSETVCRIHDSALQTQGQGHTSRSCDIQYNFMSAPYLLSPLKIFIKLHSNVPLSET